MSKPDFEKDAEAVLKGGRMGYFRPGGTKRLYPDPAPSASAAPMGGLKPEDRKGVPVEAKKKGGGVKKYARGGGIEQRGKTKGRMC